MTRAGRGSYDATVAARGVLTNARPASVPAAFIRASRMSTRIAAMFLPAATTGTVLACHRSALTLLVGNHLVTVAPDAAGGLPDGLNVGPVFAPATLGIRPGMPVVAGEHGLLIGEALAIDVTSATCWSPVLRRVPVAAPGLPVRASAVRAAMALDDRAFGMDRPTSSFRAVAAPLISDLAAALGEDSAATAAIGARLIGLGPGLTPSGDDLLVGLVAALFALGDTRAALLAGTWATFAATRTTPVAASFHRHAAAGDFAERLHDLLAAVLAGPPDGIARSVQRAVAWGATSGADTVLGVCLALAAAAMAEAPCQMQPDERTAA